MRVAVAGGTGVLGRRVVARLVEAGHQVRVLSRGGAANAAGWPGVESVAGDLLAPASVERLVAGCDVALHLATALSVDAAGTIDWARNDRLRVEGTEILLRASEAAGVRRCILQSVAFVGTDPEVSARGDEPLQDLPFLRSATVLERLGACSRLPCLVLRGGLFHGPGSSLWRAWEASAESGGWELPSNADDVVSLVHVSDMAAAVAAAVPADVTGTLAIVDDEPVRWRDLIGALARAHGHEVRQGSARALACRVDNGRARRLLDWRPHHRSFRSAVADAPWFAQAGARAARAG
jgi:nucleoside-diphosphate-sugar epimerase